MTEEEFDLLLGKKLRDGYQHYVQQARQLASNPELPISRIRMLLGEFTVPEVLFSNCSWPLWCLADPSLYLWQQEYEYVNIRIQEIQKIAGSHLTNRHITDTSKHMFYTTRQNTAGYATFNVRKRALDLLEASVNLGLYDSEDNCAVLFTTFKENSISLNWHADILCTNNFLFSPSIHVRADKYGCFGIDGVVEHLDSLERYTIQDALALITDIKNRLAKGEFL